MAEFLIKAVDAMHADPAKDQRGCYKRGDIVDVRPDGFQWGREEHPATAKPRKFVLVKVPALDSEKAKTLMQVQGSLYAFLEDGVTGIPVRRRRFHLLWDMLPVAARNALRDAGVLTVSWVALRDFLHDQRDNVTFAGRTL